MWLNALLVVLGLALFSLVVGLFVERSRLDQRNAKVVDDLLAATDPLPRQVVRASALSGLPAPIRRYLTHVLRDGQPYVCAVRLEQRGSFRGGGATSSWSPFTATQHVTTRPPGFVWNASVEMIPWLPVRVVDAYQDGSGILRARMGGILTVAKPAPGLELDEGELMRYLAEAPLYPTALLPEMGVRWTPIDDRSARATLEDRGTTASLVFHVNDRNEVEHVTGQRAFATDDGTYEYRPWRGYWKNYEEREGMHVPIDGEVAWVHSEEEVSYWRGHVDTVEYQTAQGPQPEALPVPASVNGSALSLVPGS